MHKTNKTNTHPKPSDGRSRYHLAVVQFDALQIVTRHQMLQRLVGDQRTVVQLQHGQAFGRTAAGSQLTDAVVRDQFAVRQGLDSRIRDLNCYVLMGLE